MRNPGNFRLPIFDLTSALPYRIVGKKRERVGMPSPNGTERRTGLRHLSLNSIWLCFDHDESQEMHIGAMLNVSDSGMCVVTSTQLREGGRIIIKNERSLLSQKAIVRWVKNFQQNFCKAGLLFTE